MREQRVAKTQEALISIESVRPDFAQAVQLLSELDADLQRHPYRPESRHAFSVEKLIRESVAFFVAAYDGQLAACGGVKLFADYGEVKHVRAAGVSGKGPGQSDSGLPRRTRPGESHPPAAA